MNRKLFSSIFLISGTAIGAGLLALPLVLSKIGVLPLMAILCATWAFMYFISLMSVELALRKTKPFSLGISGFVSFAVLFYALLTAYLDGSASIIQNMFLSFFQISVSYQMVLAGCFIVLVVILSSLFIFIEALNSFLLVVLLLIIAFLIGSTVLKVPLALLPWIESQVDQIGVWAVIIPLIFTSFGFNVVLEPVSILLDKNPRLIKRALFWGSLIPLCVYLVWTIGIIYVLRGVRMDVYQSMILQELSLGDLVHVLGELSGHGFVQGMVWVVSLFSIFTSALGIGLGLIYLFETYFLKKVSLSGGDSFKTCSYGKHLFLVFCLVLPALCITIFFLDSFIKILSFAGMILVINAVLLPLYEAFVTHRGEFVYFPILKVKCLLWGAFGVAILIILSEVYSLVSG